MRILWPMFRLRHLVLGIACLTLARGSAQFGGPYAILAQDSAGQLLDAPDHLSRYLAFRHLAGRQGSFGSMFVTSVITDARDTYWLGTRTGLLRLDGSRQQVYMHDPQDSTSMPNDLVTSLAVDAQDMLWVGTWSGLWRLDPASGSRTRVIPGGRMDERAAQIVSMHHAFGQLWCTTWDGVFAIDTRTLEWERLLPTATVDRPPFGDGAFINGLAIPLDGGHPVIATTEGLLRIHPVTHATRPFQAEGSPRPIQPTVLAPARNGGLWCYDRRSEVALVMDSVSGIIDSLPRLHGRRSHHAMLRIHEDEGMIWISFQGGDVYAVDMEQRLVHRVNFGPVAGNSDGKVDVHAIHKDPRGRLWLGSSAGAIILLPSDARLAAVPLPQHGPHAIMCMQLAPDGTLLVGTRGDGVRWYDPATRKWHVARDDLFERGSRDHDRHNTIFAVQPLRDGRYVLATLAGLAILRPGSGTLEHLSLDLPWTGRRSLVAASLGPTGRLWVASMDQGVLELDTSNMAVLRHFSIKDSIQHLPALSVGALACTDDGTVWAGLFEAQGIARLAPGSERFEPYRTADNLPLPNVNGINLAATGQLLASTNWDGAAIVDLATGRSRRIRVSDGLPGPDVRAVVHHPDHGTWIGGRNGLARLSDDGEHVITAEIRMRGDHYSGLLLLDTLRGKLWIGDGPRLMSLDLRATLGSLQVPQVMLHGIRLNGKHVPGKQLPERLLEQDRVVFEVTVQDPILAGMTRLAYRLLPDTTWEECLGCGELVFGELPAGEHQLQLRAMDVSGEWGETTTVAAFRVKPSFWNTWQSRLLLVGMAILLALGYFRLRLFQRTAKLRAQYERERLLAEERLRIANDLHDELGSGLSLIKVRSELALDRPDTYQAQDMLGQIATSSKDLIHAMRQMIWTIRSGQSKCSDLVAYMRSYAMDYLDDHGIRCTFREHEVEHDRELSTEQRRALLLVLKEALHNVVKHAHADTVEIDIAATDRFQMRIQDNGIGLHKNGNGNGHGGVGMDSMERRATALGGSLMVHNGNGVAIELDIPLP